METDSRKTPVGLMRSARSGRLAHVMFVVLVCVLVAGCVEESPNVIRVGLLPDQSREEILRKYTPLFEHVGKRADVTFDLWIAGSYGELVDAFRAADVDLANFGALTFVQVAEDTNARPIAMRDVDREFISVILVAKDSPAQSIADLRGMSLSFGSRLSTSGHVMPRYFFNELGIDPETFFSKIIYSGSHDKTAMNVQNGDVDAGALNGELAASLFRSGRLDSDRVRVLWTTPPYADYVWTIRGGMDQSLENRILEGFLSLRFDVPEEQSILEGLGAKAYLPAQRKYFRTIREVAENMGLL